MRHAALSVIIKHSIRRTEKILLRPFDPRKWLFLLFIAFLSGNLGAGGCGHNGRGSNTCPRKAEAAQTGFFSPILAQGNSLFLTAPAAGQTQIQPQPDINKFLDWRNWPRWTYALIIAGVLVILTISVIFCWLSSRFQFVWFNAIVTDDASLAKPYADFKQQGDSLFKLKVSFLLLFWAVTAVLAGWALFNLSLHGVFQAGGNKLAFFDYFNILAAPVIVFVFLFMAGSIFMHMVDQFIVPIMAMDRSLLRPGWQNFCELYRQNTAELWTYLFVRMGLGLAAALILAVADFIIIVVIGLIGLLIMGLLYLLFILLLKLYWLFSALTAAFSILLIAVFVLLMIMLELPVAVFFRNFSLYYLSSLDCRYKPLPLSDSDRQR